MSSDFDDEEDDNVRDGDANGDQDDGDLNDGMPERMLRENTGMPSGTGKKICSRKVLESQ